MKKYKHKDYPWKKWFSKSKLFLIRGRDFDCMSHVMAQQIRNAAAKYTRDGNDISVSVYVDENSLTAYIREQV